MSADTTVVTGIGGGGGLRVRLNTPNEGRPREPLLRREAAAAYVRDNWGIPCEARTLAKLMTVGGGPLVRLAGRIPLYEKSDLDAWASSKLTKKIRSSSELQVA